MAASAPKPIKYLSGVVPEGEIEYSPPSQPMDQATLAQAILQLQNTVNEVISRLNQLCTDTSHAGDQVTGAGAAATNLFTSS